MKRAWCVLASLFVLFAPIRATAVGTFEVPSPDVFLHSAAKEPVVFPKVSAPVETESGLFDSAPAWNLTPGVLCTPEDKDFAEYRYPEAIAYCKRNTSIRDKKEVSRWYGVAWEDHRLYQYDHLLSLCLGGSNDLRNLWPMPYADARAKAKMEAALCRRLAKGEISQEEAVKQEIGWFFTNAPQALPFLLGKGP